MAYLFKEEQSNLLMGLISRVTKDLAGGFFEGLLLYAARFFSLSAMSAASSSSSSSLPKRSKSSSSSSGAFLSLTGRSIDLGPNMVNGWEGSPLRVAYSDSYEAMCLYQRAAWGYLVASGAFLKALNVMTSAWVGV